MEERQENLQKSMEYKFDNEFRFKDLPDESTPHNSTNMNKALENTSWLKQYVEEIVSGNIDLVVKSIKSVNLFDSDKWYNDLHNLDAENITIENVDGHDYYKIHYSRNIGNYNFMKGEFKENTVYTFGLTFKQLQAERSLRFNFYYTDGTYKSFIPSGSSEETTEYVTTDENKTIDYLAIGYVASANEIYVRNLMLSEGETEREYSPHINFN